MLCVNCGGEVPDGSNFCLHCGKSPVPKQPTTHSTRTLVGGIATTAVIVSLLAFAILKQQAPKQEATSPTSVQQSSPTEIKKPSAAAPPVVAIKELPTEELFKLAAPSVVEIEVFNQNNQRYGLGSGFVVSADGLLITNYHVIRGAYYANAILANGDKAAVIGVVGFDAEQDIAVLKIPEKEMKPLPLGDSDQLKIGNKVIAVGSPKGLQNTVSDGLVSQLHSGIIQTSTPISPGSSGGPVFNTHGEVVGIAVATAPDAQNLNFAVPINLAKRYVNGGEMVSLSEIAKQNTVLESLLNSTVPVPAGQRRSWNFAIDRNRMSSPELKGSFTSTGGLGGNIRLLVVAENGVLYDSGRTTNGVVNLPLKPGKYQLVLDNTGSLAFARSVSADFQLHYVK
jgi:hypothetical protein